MKINIKIILILIVLIIAIMLAFAPNSMAKMPSFDDIKGQADDWVSKGEQGALIGPSEIAEIIMPIAKILVGIGTVIILVVAVVMGIKYMTASPDEAAKLKTQLIGLVVSAVVIFGAYTIWSVVYTFMRDLT